MRYIPLLFLLLVITTTSDGAELLAKYDFESDPKWLPQWGAGVGSKYQPAASWKSPFKVTLDKTDSHSGDGCLKMERISSEPGEIVLHTNAISVPAPADGQKINVTIRFYIRSSGFAEKNIQLRGLEKDAASRTLYMLSNSKSLVSIPASEEWAEVRWQGMLDANTRQLVVMFVAASSNAPASLWLDDISVEADSVEAVAR